MGFTGKFKMGCRAALGALLLLVTSSTLALGLGEITLNSSLNEPLDAEIVVLSSEDLEDGQLLVSLASPEAFERAGISRDFFLQPDAILGLSQQLMTCILFRLLPANRLSNPILIFLSNCSGPPAG